MKIRLLLLLLFLDRTVYGQDENRFTRLITPDIGFGIIGCREPVNDFIRGTNILYNAYSFDPESDHIRGLSTEVHFGINVEWMPSKNKSGLLAGIRYSGFSNSLANYYSLLNIQKFFYFKYKQSGTVTEYFRVKNISEKLDYLGIPVEIRWFPFRSPANPFYFKIGAEFNVLIHQDHDVSFVNDAMEQYEQGLLAMIGEPAHFMALFNISGGLRINKPPIPRFNFDYCVIPVILTRRTSGLVSPTGGYGVQFNIQFPF